MLAGPRLAWPCATVDTDPNSLRTGITSEEAIVVFDGATNTEHFIRAAAFSANGDSSSADFGFIVPTPTAPTFGEIDPSIFNALGTAYEAARPEHTSLALGSMLLLSKGVSRGLSTEVAVLSESRVAGLDVTVVKASDAAALRAWLTEHHFVVRPQLETWLTHYVERGWVFSAFRYVADQPQVTSKAVRISFATPTPVYPYFEPADALPRLGALRVWVLARERRSWGESATFDEKPEAIAASSALKVPAALLALVPGAQAVWVTLFIDHRHRRPATDVVFNAALAPSNGELLPARDKVIELPFEGFLCLATVLTLMWVFSSQLRRLRGRR